MVRRALVVVAIGCGARPPLAPAVPVADIDVTLYRDVALIRQRVAVDVAARDATVGVELAAGATADQVALVDRGGLDVRVVHGEPGPARPADGAIATPELRLEVRAPHPGHYAVAIAYATQDVRWDAAYTMTTTPARERAVLHGAIAIRNTTGLVLRGVSARVVDAPLAATRQNNADQLAVQLVGGTPDSRPPATPRELGRIDLGDGETRVELLAEARPHAMHSVLVYDPIGTKLDVPSTAPARDPALGVEPPPTTHVTESFEVARDEHEVAGLPAGP
ncbi:MAG: hypothetical protein ACM31C_34325, partial [Acidobacteriota bacterium]